MPVRYYTFKRDVPLKPGQVVGYTKGKGYYAKKKPLGPPAPPPKPKPVEVPSIFSGRGLLAVPTWESVEEIAGVVNACRLDWVAVLARLSTRQHVEDLRARIPASTMVVVWEDENSDQGAAAVSRLGCDHGYIGQAEGIVQHAACLARGPALDAAHIEKAMVGSVTYLSDSKGDALPWPAGWVCMPETYWQANPNASPAGMVYEARKRGAKKIILCFGLYVEGSQTRVMVTTYLVAAAAIDKTLAEDWCGYRVGSLDPADIEYLKTH